MRVNKRIVGPLLTIILIVGVGAAIYFSVSEQLLARRVVEVSGLIGSEKEEFFQDERVVQALRRNGLQVTIQKAGSRDIATSFNLEEYDFVFPAGVPAAEKIRREQGISQFYDVYFTPMAIASWHPIAEILVANGVATAENGYYLLEMEKFLALITAEQRWSELEQSTNYAVGKKVLVTTTDVRRSNSAAMWLGLASYVANGNRIVQSDQDIAQVMPLMQSLFLEQGFTEYSSEAPFEDYLVMGMGKAPLVLIYESQYIAHVTRPGGVINPEMVLVYPTPTIFTKHILVPLSSGGERLGEALSNDSELRQLAIEYGFRNSDVAYFNNFVESHQLPIPSALLDVVEAPSYEMLEKMIVLIEANY
jgi:hypothetical protein